MVRQIAIEEDGDEVFTPMDQCYNWKCQTWNKNVVVRPSLIPTKKYGTTFMCCPICGGSYGEKHE